MTSLIVNQEGVGDCPMLLHYSVDGGDSGHKEASRIDGISMSNPICDVLVLAAVVL